MKPAALNPITEDDIAQFLVHTPDFFDRHAELLATVRLGSPHGGRAVSLQERQAEMLREKIRALEARMMEMIRHGNDNAVLAHRLQRWSKSLFLVPQARDLPRVLAEQIEQQFMVPQVALRLWGLAPDYQHEAFVQGVSEDVKLFAASLSQPYCGINNGFEAAQWLADPAAAQSVALVTLRDPLVSDAPAAIGMLVLASPDSQRYHAGMGTEFLDNLSALASAAVQRLR
ncbi:MAG: DUF484 family protein [Betaproteobacteria bacterium]|nr:DUF484 family protein [Betaproteobacteria bacterium]NBY05615.1 DUF484 family protein [Betaproteobacteria bacterium]